MITNIDKTSSALVFVEFQTEWIGRNARLKRQLVKDTTLFDESRLNAEQIIDKARKNNWSIVHAGLNLQHDPDYLIFGRGKDKFGLASAIPKAQTWDETGASFVAPFIPQPNEFNVQGRSGSSVLKNSTLDPFLRHNKINSIILMGFALHVCIESTLRDAHDSGLHCYVVTDACGAFERCQVDYFKRHTLPHFGCDITTKELLNDL